MRTILIAGYPKSGNTLLGGALQVAGHCSSDFDIYTLRREKKQPMVNHLFDDKTYVLKTHDRWRPNDDLNKRYYAPVSKVIVVIRNPFDTLLSSINFLRVQYRSGNLDAYLKTFYMLFPEAHVCDDFLEFYALDNLREQGLLDIALENFALFGACIPNFSKMSGPWPGFSDSYKYSGLSVLKVKYEDLAVLSERSQLTHNAVSMAALNQLSAFLDVDPSLLFEGFKKHRVEAILAQNSGSLFFNKMKAGYWRDYFSGNVCADFVNQYAVELIGNGYKDLVDEFYS